MPINAGIPGRLPSAPDEYNNSWAQRMVGQLDRAHQLMTRAISTGWTTPTNVTTTKTFNANSTTVAELADVLGTLITDMKDRGMLSD